MFDKIYSKKIFKYSIKNTINLIILQTIAKEAMKIYVYSLHHVIGPIKTITDFYKKISLKKKCLIVDGQALKMLKKLKY